jgi:hypothetical protein
VREIRLHGSEGGRTDINRFFLPLSIDGKYESTSYLHTLILRTESGRLKARDFRSTMASQFSAQRITV